MQNNKQHVKSENIKCIIFHISVSNNVQKNGIHWWFQDNNNSHDWMRRYILIWAFVWMWWYANKNTIKNGITAWLILLSNVFMISIFIFFVRLHIWTVHWFTIVLYITLVCVHNCCHLLPFNLFVFDITV